MFVLWSNFILGLNLLSFVLGYGNVAKMAVAFQTSFKWSMRLEGMSEIQVTKMEKSISNQRQNWSPTNNTLQMELHLILRNLST